VRIGYDRPEVRRRALAAGAIDEAREDVTDAVSEADLVILATSVGGILDLLPRLGRAVSHRALVTDVGSTKRLICQRAREAFGQEPMFLGGHPLAGKERSGIENAEGSLFDNASYALTPLSPDHLSDERVQSFCALIKGVGARPFVTDPAAHDRAVAYLSHLPQLLSSGLASLIAEESAEEFFPLELAASGLRDVTRLADSPYPLWRDICLTNRENIQAALESLIQKLESMKVHLSDRELEREFKQALQLRERLRSTQHSG
jgi:prephenate dehydrogenase